MHLVLWLTKYIYVLLYSTQSALRHKRENNGHSVYNKRLNAVYVSAQFEFALSRSVLSLNWCCPLSF